MKPRSCPHCGYIMDAAEFDYTFDEHLNMFCGSCEKVVFSTQTTKDDEFKSTYKSTYTYHHTQHQQTGYNHSPYNYTSPPRTGYQGQTIP